MKRSLLSPNSPCLHSKDVHRLISEQVSHLLSDAIWFYRVATVYVVHHQIPYRLGMAFLLPEYSVLDVFQSLLAQVAALKLQIRGLYLDTGFCCQDVITFLKDKPYQTVIACPLRGKKAGTRALCAGRSSYFTDYAFNAGKPEAYTVEMAVVRTYEKRHGQRRAAWLLYVLVKVKTRNPQAIRARYRSRFGIETGYRCMRQTHAMTTSRNPTVRFFLLGIAFLITNLWRALRWRYCQRPQQGGRAVNKMAYELQRQCQFLAQFINDRYHPLACIYAQIAPLDP